MRPLPEDAKTAPPRPQGDVAALRRFDEWLAGAGLPSEEGAIRRRALLRALDIGLPGPRDEDWRTMDLKGLVLDDFLPDPTDAPPAPALVPADATDAGIVFLDGRVRRTAADVETFDLHDAARPADRVLRDEPVPGGPDADVFRLLNRAAATHGLRLLLDEEEERAPLRILDRATGRNAHARHDLRLGTRARAMLTIEAESADGLLRNDVLDIALGAGARLDLVLIQRTAAGARHLLRVFARLDHGARLAVRHVLLGAGAARAEHAWTLDGARAHGDLAGLMLAPRSARLDMAVRIAHRTGGATSDQRVRSIVAPTARAACAGGILVAPGADGTDARQQLRGLLLAPGAECDFKPELEIHAEDVACSHGAAIGSLDEEQLFYLTSRGLDEATARRLLVAAFAGALFGTTDDDPAHAPIAAAIGDGMDALLANDRDARAKETKEVENG